MHRQSRERFAEVNREDAREAIFDWKRGAVANVARLRTWRLLPPTCYKVGHDSTTRRSFERL
jgi:hypothetical protein